MTDQTLVALTPAEMVPAQAELEAWCDRKIQALSDEADELELHQKLAIENGWKTSVVTASLNRAARRITYYTKIKAALAEGYLLVPNMPVDILAVRTSRVKPPHEVHTSRYSHFAAKAQALPAGAGRYVDETLTHIDESYTTTDAAGKTERKTMLVADDYDEVDFPVKAMKPVILQAAARAMALRIFDQLGTVQNEGRDPILLGQILDPRGNRRRVSFFIAWWVDPATL